MPNGITINSYGTLNLCVPDTQSLAQILTKLDILIQKGVSQMAALDDLATQVKSNTDAEASAVTVLTQLHDMLVAAGTDPTKLQSLKTQLAVSRDALAAAIVANTPAAPPSGV